VIRLVRSTAVLLLGLATAAGSFAVCDGWKASPEARMACCADGLECPMHPGERGDSASLHSVSQSAADACCAASEREDGPPSGVFAMAPLPLTLVATIPAFDLQAPWVPISAHVEWPPPAQAVARHLLLSVILV